MFGGFARAGLGRRCRTAADALVAAGLGGACVSLSFSSVVFSQISKQILIFHIDSK